MNRKNIYILFGMLLFTLVACTKDEKEYIPDVYLSFDPIVVANTRLADAGAYPQDQPFSVWAYSLPDGKSWKEDMDQLSPVMENVTISYANGEWLPQSSYSWPQKCGLTFYACSPQNINAAFTFEEGITLKNFDTNSAIVPMFTYPVQSGDRLLSSGCIALPFVRTLTKLEFAIRTIVTSDSVMILKKLYLDDIAYKGDFQSLPYARWNTHNERMCMEFCDSSMRVNVNTCKVGERLVMPQLVRSSVNAIIDIYDKEGNVIVTDRKISSEPLNKALKVGKYYTYTLNLSTRSMTFTTDILDFYDDNENN